MQPLVSIAMPARNAQATVALAIRSLLGQTYADWELFIVDDGSSDDTVRIARRFVDQRIHVQTHGRQLGLAARLNEIIDQCSGDYFARLDADDIAYPERLQRQIDFLLRHESVDLLGTGAMLFDRGGGAIGLFPVRTIHAEICRDPWSGFYLAHPTWMGRTAWFRRHRYRPELAKAQDQDLLLRTHGSSTFACLPETLVGYRQETLSLRKIIAGRFSFSRALIRQARIERRFVHAVTGPVKQVGKSILDTLAISSGLGRRLLRHRATPASETERAHWNAVWVALKHRLSRSDVRLHGIHRAARQQIAQRGTRAASLRHGGTFGAPGTRRQGNLDRAGVRSRFGSSTTVYSRSIATWASTHAVSLWPLCDRLQR